jgi:hypothetical protein
MYRTSWLALAAALGALAPVQSFAQPAPRFEFQATAAEDPGFGAGAFVPFLLGDGTLFYADGWLNYQPEGSVAGSIGMGVRQEAGNWVLGANGYLDYLHSSQDFGYAQLGAGLEAISQHWEFRLNGYAPIGDTANAVDAASRVGIANGQFVANQGYEVALYGLDAEVGFRMPVFAADSTEAWKVYGGAFIEGSDLSGTTSGVSLRTELTLDFDQQLVPGSTFSLGGGLRYDSNDDLSASAYIRFSAPIGGTSSSSATADPLYQRIERNRLIRTSIGAFGSDEVVTGAGRSSRVIEIASGTSTADLNARIAGAGEGAIVLASGDIAVDSSLTLLTNQMLVGGGGVIDLKAADGRTFQYQNPGQRTVLYGSGTIPSGNRAMTTLAAAVQPDVLVLADGNTISTLSIVGGNNAIVGRGVNNITIDRVDISGVSGNGIMLNTVVGATISNSRISDTFICESSFDCEFSIFDPDNVPHAAINAVGVRNLTITDTDIADVTYGIFVAPDFEEIDWEQTVVAPSAGIRIDNVAITNSRREGVHIVSATDIAMNEVHIDNMALDRSMDLMVLMNSQNLTLTNSSLRGGSNGLMFAYASMLPGGLTANVQVADVEISGAQRSGVFLNASQDIDFRNVSVSDVGFFGLHLYGSDPAYGGPVSDVTLDGFSVTRAGRGALYFDGPIANIDGSIDTAETTVKCGTNTAGWGSAELTQAPGNALFIDSVEVRGIADCQSADPY